MKRRPIRTATIETSDGVFVASFSARGLMALDFPGRAVAGGSRDEQDRAPKAGEPVEPVEPIESVEGPAMVRWQQQTEQALLAALRGRRAGEVPPFDWDGRTEFQRRVWTALLQIEPGATRTYGEIAAEIGNPKAVRAVGRACGANPIPVLVPCHRVMAAGGKLGGFSGGLDWKRKLLEREGRSALRFAAAAPGGGSGR